MTTAKQMTPAHELNIRSARLTGWGWFWLLIYLGLPAMGLGLTLDFLVQTFFGWCVGVWCIFL